MRKTIILINLFLLSICGYCQTQFIFSGNIFDSESKEPLYGAIVFVNDYVAAQTDGNGYFRAVSKESDKYVIRFHILGYTDTTIILTNSSVLKNPISIFLKPGVGLSEIIISEYRNNQEFIFKSDQLEKLPSLGGVPDVMKALSLNTGIKQCKEGSSDLSVRGGGPDQNMVLIDEVPVYYLNHLGGFVSVFDAQAISQFTLWKGAFPAKFGGRTSSIIDIRLKKGNPDSTECVFSLSPLLSSLFFNGPLKKNKITYSFSIRRCFFDILSVPFTKIALDGISLGYSFSDLNAKLNFKLSEHSSLSLHSYYGFDQINVNIKLNNEEETNKSRLKNAWGNKLIGITYSNNISSDIIFTSIGYWVNYKYKYRLSNVTENSNNVTTNTTKNIFYSGINDFGIKNRFFRTFGNHINIDLGDEFVLHTYMPKNETLLGSEYDSTISLIHSEAKLLSFDNRLFVGLEWLMTEKLTITSSLNLMQCFTDDTCYVFPEPRLSAKYAVNEKFNIEASYDRATQNGHLLSNSSNSSFPANTWLPSTKQIAPQICNQIYVGISWDNDKSGLGVNSGVYYKSLLNQIGLKEGCSIIGNADNWQNLIEKNGKGYSYGLEFKISKTTKAINMWLSYTYSRSYRQFSNINSGKQYPFEFDRPHELTISTMKTIKKNVHFSSIFTLASGNPITLPNSMLYSMNNYYSAYNPVANALYPSTQPITPNSYLYNSINSDRLPIYHRLDVSLSFTKNKKHGIRTWAFSIYNVYNKKNAFLYDFSFDTDRNKIIARKVTMFPFFPGFSYSFKWY